jgi:hypothetical protein
MMPVAVEFSVYARVTLGKGPSAFADVGHVFLFYIHHKIHHKQRHLKKEFKALLVARAHRLFRLASGELA